ncbi:MAG: hypothetical protein EAZ85_16305 [Bacteroidetes bacterium]|nr:MAG: hypothetical protein EAZ85_16305 [Bacteroidota bacterium]TAG94959.1 MAG: hypothetical protein EAZ20_00530 [Bacteroidota bacterium]
MKISFFWLILVLLGITLESNAQDTITIDMNNRARILVIAKDKEALKALRRIDINKIVREAMESLDSTEINNNTAKVFEYDLGADGWELNLRKQIDREIEANKDGKVNSVSFNFGRKNRITNSRVSNFWSIDLGFNNYTQNGSLTSNQPYSLSTLGSRYFALGWHKRFRVGGEKSPLRMQIGVEASWYNFVFTNNNYLTMRPDAANPLTLKNEYRDFQTDFQKGLSKSKLTVMYLNIPFNVHFRFRKSGSNQTAFRVGVGGYVGYRLDSYSKRKYDSRPERERNNFYLNDIRYGYEGFVGFNDSFMFFFKQDLNSLFIQSDNRPDLKPFTIGMKWLF